MGDDSLTRQVRTLSAEGAKRALAAAEAKAREMGIRLCIAVVDAAGDLLAFQRMDGCLLVSIEVAMGKARTAAHLAAPTKVFQDVIEGGRVSILALRDLAPVQGGVPILVDGVLVGAIGGSGGSGEEDEIAAMAGAAAIG